MTSTTVLRWVLRNGPAAITCELGLNADNTFHLRVVPSSSPSEAIEERFTAVVPAMKRHAEVADRLRDAGWIVTDRATPSALAA